MDRSVSRVTGLSMANIAYVHNALFCTPADNLPFTVLVTFPPGHDIHNFFLICRAYIAALHYTLQAR